MKMSNFVMKSNYQKLTLLLVIVTAVAYPTLNKMLFYKGVYGPLSPGYYSKLNTSTLTEIRHLQTSTNNSDKKQTLNKKNILVYHNITVDTYVMKSSEINLSDKTNKTHWIIKRSRNSDLVNKPTASDFVFPGRPRNFVPKQDVKNCSQGGIDLCVSNVLDYPYSHIKRILKSGTFAFMNYFADDIIDVSTRFDEAVDEEKICEAEETILYPKFGKTADNDMLFIINIDENFKQGVRVESCKKSGESPCNSKLVTPTGFKTYCKQKYAYKKLLALQPNGEPAPDNFKIPSCCYCSISQDLTSFRGLLKGGK